MLLGLLHLRIKPSQYNIGRNIKKHFKNEQIGVQLSENLRRQLNKELPYKQNRITRLQSLSTYKHTPPSCEKVSAWLPWTRRWIIVIINLVWLVQEFTGFSSMIISVGILSDTPTRTEHLTSINMAEVPFLVMKITSNELLGWGLLCVIL